MLILISRRAGEIYFSLGIAPLSLESLPTSDVGFDGPALAVANSPSSPRRMILRGWTAGAGELLVDVFEAMLDKDGGILQKGVL